MVNNDYIKLHVDMAFDVLKGSWATWSILRDENGVLIAVNCFIIPCGRRRNRRSDNSSGGHDTR
jgi:hypothetical protein